MKKSKVIIIVVVTALLAALALLVIAPIASAFAWKSSTLSYNNTTTTVINETATAVEKFNANQDAGTSDFDTMVKAYEKQKLALADARKQSESVTGFKGLDLTGAYGSAEETSKKLVSAYDDLLDLTNSQLESTKAEREVIAALEGVGEEPDAAAIKTLGDKLQTVSASYQSFVQGNKVGEAETKLAELLPKLAKAFQNTAAALPSNNLAQLTAAQTELEAVLAEFEASKPLQDAQFAATSKEQQAVVDRLNAANKELE